MASRPKSIWASKSTEVYVDITMRAAKVEPDSRAWMTKHSELALQIQNSPLERLEPSSDSALERRADICIHAGNGGCDFRAACTRVDPNCSDYSPGAKSEHRRHPCKMCLRVWFQIRRKTLRAKYREPLMPFRATVDQLPRV